MPRFKILRLRCAPLRMTCGRVVYSLRLSTLSTATSSGCITHPDERWQADQNSIRFSSYSASFPAASPTTPSGSAAPLSNAKTNDVIAVVLYTLAGVAIAAVVVLLIAAAVKKSKNAPDKSEAFDDEEDDDEESETDASESDEDEEDDEDDGE